MNRIKSVIALLSLSLAAVAPHAQTVANGPYYATPSWDQTIPTATRFVVLSNFNSDAVLDRETGLVWHRRLVQPNTTGGRTGDFDQQLNECLGSRVGGRAGWRMPYLSELSSLFDVTSTTYPGLPIGHPFTGFGSESSIFIWTATPGGPGFSGHRVVGFGQAISEFLPPTSVFGGARSFDRDPRPVLCVRGGVGAF